MVVHFLPSWVVPVFLSSVAWAVHIEASSLRVFFGQSLQVRSFASWLIMSLLGINIIIWLKATLLSASNRDVEANGMTRLPL